MLEFKLLTLKLFKRNIRHKMAERIDGDPNPNNIDSDEKHFRGFLAGGVLMVFGVGVMKGIIAAEIDDTIIGNIFGWGSIGAAFAGVGSMFYHTYRMGMFDFTAGKDTEPRILHEQSLQVDGKTISITISENSEDNSPDLA